MRYEPADGATCVEGYNLSPLPFSSCSADITTSLGSSAHTAPLETTPPEVTPPPYHIPDPLPPIQTSANLESLLQQAQRDIPPHNSDGEDEDGVLSDLTEIESENEQSAPAQPSKLSNPVSALPSRQMLYKSAYRKKRKAEKLGEESAKRQKIRARNLDDLCSVPPIRTPVDAADLPATSTAWTGVRQSVGGSPCPIDKLLMQHPRLQLVRWDGKRPRAILDCKHRLIACLAGMPKDSPRWLQENEEELKSLIEKTVNKLNPHFSHKNHYHSCGAYAQARQGVSMGGGEKVST